MSKYEGFIAKLSTKTGEGARGPWALYSAKVEKADGTEYQDWVSFGFDEPKFKEGDYVSFDVETVDGRVKYIKDSGRKPKNPPARAQKSKGATSDKKSYQQRGQSAAVKYDGTGIQNRSNPVDAQRMGLSNAREMAIGMVTLLLANNALPLSKAANKAGEAKRYEELMSQVDKITVRYFNDVISGRLLETVADEGVVSIKGDGPLPDDEESLGKLNDPDAETDGFADAPLEPQDEDERF